MLIDTTLREGAQLFGNYMTAADKLEIVRRLVEIGIEEVEIGWVGQKGLRSLVKKVQHMTGISQLSLWCPCRVRDIFAASGLGIKRINIGVPVSDQHLRCRLKMTRKELYSRVEIVCQTAFTCGFTQISLGLEDFSRADRHCALELSKFAVERGVSRIRLSDTLGLLTPTQMGKHVQLFSETLDAEIGVHCHNDFGMATANTITALQSGASWGDVSVLGIGERSGIASLEEVAAYRALCTGEDIYELKNIRTLSKQVAEHAQIPIPRTKPVVGQDIFATESGLHVHAALCDPTMFEPYDPKITASTRTLGIGAKSGLGAIRETTKHLGITLSPAILHIILDKVHMASRNAGRPLETSEFHAVVKKMAQKNPAHADS